MLALEFVDRLRAEPLARPVRRKLEHGRPLRVTIIVCPRSTSRASSVKRFFASRMDTVFTRET
jgi:hypothetical protein